jgi:glycosyltransferase involved in cell wall biosynthesis
MKSIILFSRCERVFGLFRGTWIAAFARRRISVEAINRGYGLACTLTAIIKFVRGRSSIRVVFGTSEILLYSLFSKKRDFWVFTGLGRLFLTKGIINNIFIIMFRNLYRGQTIIVLNVDDQIFLDQKMGFKSYVLQGEGYLFDQKTPCFHKAGEVFSTKTVAYVGRLLKSKGVDALLQHLKDQHYPNLRFVFLGDTDFNSSDAVPKTAIRDALESKNDVQFLGFVDDVASILKDVEFQISMSEREGLPFSVLDGMIAGCSMILTDVPGHRSFFDFNGVEKFDRRRLSDILQKMNDCPSPLLNFDRQERYILAKEQFGQEKIIRDIIEIFDNGTSH